MMSLPHSYTDDESDPKESILSPSVSNHPSLFIICCALFLAILGARSFLPFWDGFTQSTTTSIPDDIPLPPPEQLPIRGLSIPIAQFGDATNPSMIRADPISIAVEATLHGSIAADQPAPIVTNDEVRAIEQQATTVLINRARTLLESYAQASGFHLEETTMRPSAADMRLGLGYERIVIPPIGQPSPDSRFRLQVRAIVSALATPRASPLAEQLRDVLSHQFKATGQISPTHQIVVTDWHWDGQLLTVDGLFTPEKETHGATLSP